MAFWIPLTLWAYGPQNFLWLCNIAQFVLLYAVWRGNRLLVSSQVGMMGVVGIGWSIDLIIGLASGGKLAGFTVYMFNPDIPLMARAASFYHVGSAFFAFWLVRRLGYDRRGPWLQSLMGGLAVVGAGLFTDPQRNINGVFTPLILGQHWLPQPLYVLCLVLFYPLVLYLPGHLLVLAWLRHWPERGHG